MYKRDQLLVAALKFVRMLAYGQTTVVLVPFLAATGASDEEIGAFMALTLVGDVVVSLGVTAVADKLGRRLMLAISSVSMLVSGLIFSSCGNFWLLLVAAIFGVISPSGNEVGPFRAIEESVIAHLTHEKHLSLVYAWQNIMGTMGMALGVLSTGWLVDLLSEKAHGSLSVYHFVFVLYAVWAAVTLVLCLSLSKNAEGDRAAGSDLAVTPSETSALLGNGGSDRISSEGAVAVGPNSAASRPRARVLSGGKLKAVLGTFFAIDSLASGFMNNSWVVEYMYRSFNSSASTVGNLLFATSILSALTSVPSAKMTDIIGSIPAIAVTKYGAGAFAALVPAVHGTRGAMTFILLRALLENMDVVPRQVFLARIIPPPQRTSVLGLVNVSKTLAQSVGPVFTGILASRGHLGLCFCIMGALEYLFATLVLAVFY